MAVFDGGATGHPKVDHSGTFNANPMSMAAGLAAMQVMENYEGEDVAKPKPRTKTIGGEEMSHGDMDATNDSWAENELDEFFS